MCRISLYRSFIIRKIGLVMNSEYSEITQSINKKIEIDSQEYAKILDSGLKVRIMMMLQIFPEMSLTKLSKKLKKAKSTISKHMNELIDLNLIIVREKHHRGSIKQKLYSVSKKTGYRGRTYDDLKNDSPDMFLKHLHEEYLINLRLFTYIQENSQQILGFINNFYPNLTTKDITDEFKEDIYRYNTCVPRTIFMTKEEYIDYREKFIEFDDEFIRQMEIGRLRNSNDHPKEYLVVHELIPIRRVLDFVLSDKNNKIKI